jgi:hypothetical protein
MTDHSVSPKIPFTIATLTLLIEYLLAGYWWILPVLLVMILFWGFTKDHEKFCPAPGLLFAYILLAAIGLLLGFRAVFMIITCATALAGWDLSHFERSIVGNAVRKEIGLVVKHHMQSLILAVSSGMTLALITALIHLRFPFWGMLVLILTAIGGLLRIGGVSLGGVGKC